MKLDCAKCIGVCCTTAGSVTVSDRDIERLSRALGVSIDEFKAVRVTVENGNQIIKSGFNPCPFLSRGKCTVYEARPDTCRDYWCWERNDLTYGLAKQLAENNVTEGRLDVRVNGNRMEVTLNPEC